MRKRVGRLLENERHQRSIFFIAANIHFRSGLLYQDIVMTSLMLEILIYQRIGLQYKMKYMH